MDFLDKGTCFPQPYFEEEVIYLLNDINIMFQKLFHEFYSPYGLTMVQIPVLMTLKRNGKMMVSELGRQLEIGSSNITPLCKRMENAGLVTRTRSQEDQRVVHVEITPHAIEIIEKIEREILDSAPQMKKSDEADRIILDGLSALYERLENHFAERMEHNT